MRYHHRILVAALSILCINSPALASQMTYEAVDGTRCQVVNGRPPTLDFEVTDDSVSAGLSIPLGQPSNTARRLCEDMNRLDQLRAHFTWLQEMYEAGVITRTALEKAGRKLGLELADDQPTTPPSFEISIP